MKLKIDISLLNEQDAMATINQLRDSALIYYDVYKTICTYEPMNLDEQILMAYITTMKLTDAVSLLDMQGVRLGGQIPGQSRKASQRDIVRLLDESSTARVELAAFAKLIHKVNKGEISFNELVKRVKDIAYKN